MANAHQNGDLLLQALNSTALARTGPLLELLDRIARSRSPIYTHEYTREVTFAKLLTKLVLRVETCAHPLLRISEGEASHFGHLDHVAIVQLNSLVATELIAIDDCAID